MPASTQPALGLSPNWKIFNNEDRISERPCGCHEHGQGKHEERGEGVCSQGTAKEAELSGEPWREIFVVCNLDELLIPVSNLRGGEG